MSEPDMKYLTDDRDARLRNVLWIRRGGNGDWYVGSAPEGEQPFDKMVRICTSGGASSRCPGLTKAIQDVYASLRRGDTSFPTPDESGREPAAPSMSFRLVGAPSADANNKGDVPPPGVDDRMREAAEDFVDTGGAKTAIEDMSQRLEKVYLHDPVVQRVLQAGGSLEDCVVALHEQVCRLQAEAVKRAENRPALLTMPKGIFVVPGYLFAVSNDGGKTWVAMRENLFDAIADLDLQNKGGGNYAVVVVKRGPVPQISTLTDTGRHSSSHENLANEPKKADPSFESTPREPGVIEKLWEESTGPSP